MYHNALFNHATLIRDEGLLKDTRHVPVEELSVMILCIVSHKAK